MLRSFAIVMSLCLALGFVRAEDEVKPIKALLICGGC